ncbi:hypothetical protein OGAPHI_000664 [Ogataea philodendri]|uniref:BHLH domain-containing protein n=1 Tax=Ogataea philodendri TaxID=1378263 RepID=A0A9P8T941_9ASCO|nr:uncharacterized protein OGAPHI_000664 [Ogataea philodendri]KAH3670953.1 hypothetical protein OGAPHI_000664 [Ogataea philodendri]
MFSANLGVLPPQGNYNTSWENSESNRQTASSAPADYFSSDLDFDTAYVLMTNELDSTPGSVPNSVPGSSRNAAMSHSLSPGTNSTQTSTNAPQTPPLSNFMSTGLSPFYRSPKIVHEQLSRPLTPDNTRPPYDKTSLLNRSSSSLNFAELSPVQANSPVSPNTRNLLATFNNLNYSANVIGLSRQQSSELLSVSETSALENFLDSIANDQSLSNLSKHWHSIDPLANSIRENAKEPQPATKPFIKKEEDSIPTHVFSAAPSVEEKLARASFQERQRSVSLSKKQLTEEEKKLNHTSSEKKRRAVIKRSFDELCELISSSPTHLNQLQSKNSKSKRKKMSKYNVMVESIEEIKRLEEVNQRLKELVR